MKKSLKPIVPCHSNILILGSMPGEASLRAQQYYAHPRNLFWTIIARAVGKESPPDKYEERIAMLEVGHIALWDVFAAAEREGSLDADIRKSQLNDINALLKNCPGIKKILFNGKKAASAAKDCNFDIPFFVMPSTSPANARMKKEDKIAYWLNQLL